MAIANLGIKYYLTEPHVTNIEDMEGVDINDFDRFYKIRTVVNINGNGYKEVDILTDGEITPIEAGEWKIFPIVKMPYSWKGNRVELKAFDKDGKMHVFKDKLYTYKTSDYELVYGPYIIWIEKTINNLHKIENAYHADLLDRIREAKRVFEIYTERSSILIDKVNEFLEDLKPVIRAIKEDNLEESSKQELIESLKEIEEMINKNGVAIIGF